MKYIKLYEQREPEHEIHRRPDGSWYEQWRLNNQLHREDGPAEIWYHPDGSVQVELWWVNNQRHREGGPAWISYYPDGSVQSEEWWRDEKVHREDGPAHIYYDKKGNIIRKYWAWHGVVIEEVSTDEEFEAWKGLLAMGLIEEPSEADLEDFEEDEN